jgi:hypothetical protein
MSVAANSFGARTKFKTLPIRAIIKVEITPQPGIWKIQTLYHSKVERCLAHERHVNLEITFAFISHYYNCLSFGDSPANANLLVATNAFLRPIHERDKSR